ncbi:hypothetical protein BTVI_53881 [Pitangus sulphuratus]|nr:hypothetical protein BTVI_53881 [Pitangus sulphuratus]
MLTSVDKLIKGVKIGGSLSCSDHALVEFVTSRRLSLARSQLKTLNFGKAKFQLFKKLVNEIPWVTVLKDKGADQSWQLLRTSFLRVQEQRNMDKFEKSGPTRTSCSSTNPSASCCNWVRMTQIEFRLADELIVSSPAEKDLGVLVEEKVNMSLQYGSGRPESPLYPGLHQKRSDQQVEGGDLPLLCPCETHLEHCTQSWGPQHKKDVDQLHEIQRRPPR